MSLGTFSDFYALSISKKNYGDLEFWFNQFMTEFNRAESDRVLDSYLGTNLAILEQEFPNASLDFIGVGVNTVEIGVSCYELSEKDDVFKFAFGRHNKNVEVLDESVDELMTSYSVNIKLSKYQTGMLSRYFEQALKEK